MKEKVTEITWSDFLGIDVCSPKEKHEKFLSFKEAKTFARSLNLKSSEEWKNYHIKNKIENIPINVQQTYSIKNEWTNWGDFLGTGFVAYQNRKYLSFEEAKRIAKSLNISSKDDWFKYFKGHELPNGMPKSPFNLYKKTGEWKGWGDFLGTGRIATFDKKFKTFNEAKNYIQALELKSQDEFKKLMQSEHRPSYIPSDPLRTYKEEWEGWGCFLGTSNISLKDKEHMPFKEARIFARSLNLKNIEEWKEYCNANKNPKIKIHANETYTRTGEWEGWGDFLGTGRNQGYMTYYEAKDFIKDFNFRFCTDFSEWYKNEPMFPRIPCYPPTYYKKEWKGWKDFLGSDYTNPRSITFISYENAKSYAKKHKIKSGSDWRKHCKSKDKALEVPSNVESYYKRTGEWLSWHDFLGKINHKRLTNPKNMI